MKPNRDGNGLPLCSEDACEDFDGKRCGLMGFRPDRFCEPALVDEKDAARREVEELRGHITARDDDEVRLRAEIARLQAILATALVPCQDHPWHGGWCSKCVQYRGYVPVKVEP